MLKSWKVRPGLCVCQLPLSSFPILLEQEQHDTLREIANRKKRSLSEVAREIIELGLQIREKETENLWRKREDALKRLSQIREETYQNYGVYEGDLVFEDRTEREK